MFTGLIEDVGKIKGITRKGSGQVLSIDCGLPLEEIVLGESIAVDGVCLTVTSLVSGGFTVDVSPESLQRTTLGSKRPGHTVNLERALRLSDRLGGHLVSGHIDGTAVAASIEPTGDFILIAFTAPDTLLKYIIDKGSVAIDGISLTVNECTDRGFSVMIIPHTFAHTTLSTRKAGDRVNIENDIIGKYVEKLLTTEDTKNGGITRDFLEKFNFT